MPSQTYKFALDSFTIRDTRSKDRDTVYASLSLSVGDGPTSTKTRALGNFDNGTYDTGLSFENVTIDDADVVVLSYTMVNNGTAAPDQAEQALRTAAQRLADKAAQHVTQAAGAAIGAALGVSIGTAVAPLIGSAIGALAGWLTTEIGNLAFPNCDGVVATAVRAFTGTQLRAATGNFELRDAANHPGTNSPPGCGKNSDYDVTLDISTVNTRNWQHLPGAAVDIGVGADGSAWVIGNNPVGAGYGIYRWDGTTWRQSSGEGTRIAVDSGGNPWVVNSAGGIFRWTGGNWQHLPGAAVDIGVGADGSAWVIGNNPVGAGYGIYRWDGTTWRQSSGEGTNIAVDSGGNPWVVNSAGGIFRWTGGNWQHLPGAAVDIGVGADGSAWVIGNNPVGAGYGIYRWDGTTWRQSSGEGTNIAVDSGGNPWVVNSAGGIFRRA